MLTLACCTCLIFLTRQTNALAHQVPVPVAHHHTTKMLCAISGEAPREPVASRKSGNVFEKRLIEAHVAENHTDPVTGEDLAVEDLIELKSPQVVTPRAPNLTSIPALLSAFQNEWDAIVLETHTLKQQLAQTRQELSTALYQNDAATRVVARLSRERDEAREALSNVTISGGGGASHGDAMHVDGQALPQELVAKVDETQAQYVPAPPRIYSRTQLTRCRLFATRRKRPVPAGWATGDELSTFDTASSSEPLYPGSSKVVLNESGDLALFGGADGVAGIYSISQQKVVQALKAGSAVTTAAWWGHRAVVGTAAGNVKIFEDGAEIAHLGAHAGAVTSVSVHPSGAMLASGGADKRFAYYDLATFTTVSQIYTEAGISCCSFHVDGLLFFVGSADGKIRIYDVKTGSNMVELETGSPVRAISFNENGTWFAVVQKGSSSVSVWDIRKQNIVKVLDAGSPVESATWDYTGQFLAAAGTGSVSVHQYTKASKSWSEPVRKAVPARDVAWGANGQSIVALTPEGGLSILSAS
jgi:pre-mRNA-processing factor 19